MMGIKKYVLFFSKSIYKQLPLSFLQDSVTLSTRQWPKYIATESFHFLSQPLLIVSNFQCIYSSSFISKAMCLASFHKALITPNYIVLIK